MTAGMTAGLAGCTGALGGGDGPETVVELFYKAINDGERETANGFIHSDSPAGEITEEDMSYYEDTTITVEETEILEESDDVAEVKATITAERDSGSSTEETTFELRTEDGEWKLYQ